MPTHPENRQSELIPPIRAAHYPLAIRRHCSHLKRTIINTENMLDRFSATPYSSAPLPPRGVASKQCGEVSEWLKEHAWKVCIRQRIGGSNPPLTAIISDKSLYESTGFFFYILPHRGDEKPRPGVDNRRQPGGQMTSPRGICPLRTAFT